MRKLTEHGKHRKHSDFSFLITDPEGPVYEFYDFTQTSYPPGALKRVLTAGNHVIEVQSFNNDGQITEVRESFTEGDTTTINSWGYTYLSSGDNAGRLETVTLRRKEFTSPDTEQDVNWSYQRKVTYDYYELDEDHGGVTKERNQVLQKTTTLPTVSSTQNGSGSTAAQAESLQPKFYSRWNNRFLALETSSDLESAGRVKRC